MTEIRSFEPFISTPKDSPAHWLLDILWVVHATGEQTQGSYSLVEQWMPYGAGPPPHVHPYADESFFVLEGEMTVEVGGKTLVLGPGSLGHVPRNTVHSFDNVCRLVVPTSDRGVTRFAVGFGPAKSIKLRAVATSRAIRATIAASQHWTGVNPSS